MNIRTDLQNCTPTVKKMQIKSEATEFLTTLRDIPHLSGFPPSTPTTPKENPTLPRSQVKGSSCGRIQNVDESSTVPRTLLIKETFVEVAFCNANMWGILNHARTMPLWFPPDDEDLFVRPGAAARQTARLSKNSPLCPSRTMRFWVRTSSAGASDLSGEECTASFCWNPDRGTSCVVAALPHVYGVIYNVGATEQSFFFLPPPPPPFFFFFFFFFLRIQDR